MSREDLDRLTAAEWKVMKIVWRRKSCSSRDVYEEARMEHGWAPTTTKTLLRRLVEKSHLTRDPRGYELSLPPGAAGLAVAGRGGRYAPGKHPRGHGRKTSGLHGQEEPAHSGRPGCNCGRFSMITHPPKAERNEEAEP